MCILLLNCRYWCQEYEETLSEMIASLLTSKYQNSSPNKRKRPTKNVIAQNTSPTSDQVSLLFIFIFLTSSQLAFYSAFDFVVTAGRLISLPCSFIQFFFSILQLLSHLEHFRRSCRHGNGTGTGLYVQDAMQRALQQAFSHSSDSIKVCLCNRQSSQ